MSSTILELQSQIEELEKRIKAISNAQTLHQQLSALQDYFDNIQDCLIEMNSTLDEVLIKNSQQDQSISTLTSNIATINSQLANSESNGESSGNGNSESGNSSVDLSEIEAEISTLTQNFQSLSQQLTSLKNGSTTNLSAIETDIDTLQTDLGYAQDAIDQNASDISSINSTIGEQQTVLTNLQTTQTNLSTSQSSLSSTVSGINSRLSAVETNVSNLSGGVDFSEYQDRLDNVEQILINPYTYGYQRTVLLTPTDKYVVSPEYYLCSTLHGYMRLEANIRYSSESSGSVTLTTYLNGSMAETTTIDLSKHPDNFKYEYSFLPTAPLQKLKFTLSSSASITYSDLRLSVFASGGNILSHQRDIEIKCAGGQILGISRDDKGFKYKFFDPNSNISLTSISTRVWNYDNDDKYIYMDVQPYSYVSNSTIMDWAFGVIKVRADGTKTIEPLVAKTSEYSLFDKQTITMNNYTPLDGMNYSNPMFLMIYNNLYPGYQRLIYNSTTTTFTGLNNKMTGNWLYAVPIQNNNRDVNTAVRADSNLMAVALYEDGYMYAIFKAQGGYAIKLSKGNFATAYEETDGSLNIYVSDHYDTAKFKLVMGSNNKYELSTQEKMANINCVYETYNNQIIAYYPKTKYWSVETKEY